MEQEQLVELGLYPHSRRGSITSLIILFIFIIVFRLLFNTLTVQTFLLVALAVIPLTLITINLRLITFISMIDQLLQKGVHSSPPPSPLIRIAIFLGGLLFLFGPFFTVTILDPVAWFLSIGGVICGITIGELIFTLYIRKWTQHRELNLMRFEIWSVHESGRRTLREKVVRVSRENNQDTRHRYLPAVGPISEQE